MLLQRVVGAPAASMLPRARHHALTVRLVELTWTRVLLQPVAHALLGSTQLLSRRRARSALQVKLI